MYFLYYSNSYFIIFELSSQQSNNGLPATDTAVDPPYEVLLSSQSSTGSCQDDLSLIPPIEAVPGKFNFSMKLSNKATV